MTMAWYSKNRSNIGKLWCDKVFGTAMIVGATRDFFVVSGLYQAACGRRFSDGYREVGQAFGSEPL